jgi:3-hydroxy-D-aspartate aldolase
MNVYRPAEVGMALADVDTPALLLDLDAFERNLDRMDAALAGTNISLRPHAKSHKCPEIALRQIKRGAVGVCCQKVSEAEAMVDGGVRDVLIANEAVGPAKLERLTALAKRARVAVCADDAGNVAALNEAARAAGVRLDVLVEVNVGANRCGVEPGEPSLRLAQAIAHSRNLRFAGLQAYQGAAQHLRKVEERRAAIYAACAQVRETTELLEDARIKCDKVTGAGTGTFLFEAMSGVYDELQAGSYIFMDADYARNDWTESGIPRFEHSLFVWTTVMSSPTPNRAVVDAGLKASSVDSGMPRVADVEGAEYVKASDEHGVLKLGGKARLALGRVEALWPITARGAVW